MKTPQLYVGTYLYVSPPDTRAEGENPTIQVLTKVDTLEEVIDFIHENFDGLETFREHFEPEILEHFKDTKKEYHGDDYSAGQWFKIAPIINGTAELTEL